MVAGDKWSGGGSTDVLFIDAQIGASRGDAVLGLLERAQVPPVPPFYKLCYDYLAGERTLDALRAGAIIEAPQNGPLTAGEQLYDDFIAPYRTDESAANAVGHMLERLKILELVIGNSQEASRAQAVTLAGASVDLASDGLDRLLMREWVARLAATNAAMHAANAALSVELELTHGVLEGARVEMAKASHEATIDPLTGVANRSGLDRALEIALNEARGGQGQLALAVIDIDHFKRLNDTYGHQAGDEILRLVARALVVSTREGDVVGRLGGDEFVAILDGTDATDVAERMRRAIIDSDVTQIFGKDVLGSVTASIGIAGYQEGDSVSQLLDRADRRLFEAKKAGRNRVAGDIPQRDAA